MFLKVFIFERIRQNSTKKFKEMLIEVNDDTFLIEIQKIVILSVWDTRLKHTDLLHYSINNILMPLNI
jgi:hypothetical protein